MRVCRFDMGTLESNHAAVRPASAFRIGDDDCCPPFADPKSDQFDVPSNGRLQEQRRGNSGASQNERTPSLWTRVPENRSFNHRCHVRLCVEFDLYRLGRTQRRRRRRQAAAAADDGRLSHGRHLGPAAVAVRPRQPRGPATRPDRLGRHPETGRACPWRSASR